MELSIEEKVSIRSYCSGLRSQYRLASQDPDSLEDAFGVTSRRSQRRVQRRALGLWLSLLLYLILCVLFSRSDIRTIIQDDAALEAGIGPALEQYNIEQYSVTELPGSNEGVRGITLTLITSL